MKIIKQAWIDIRQGENLDLYLTVVVAILLAILNLFGLGQSFTAPITLAVLALIAVSGLVNRHRIERAITKLGPSASRFFREEYPPSIKEDIENCKEIWLMGITLGRTMPTYYTLFRDKLQGRFKLRVLLVAPEGAANGLAAKRTGRPMTPEQNAGIIHSTLVDACNLKQEAPDKVEIKTLNYLFPFGAYIMNPKQQNAIIYLSR